MTNEQILKKAIEKAVKNGWKGVNPLEVKAELRGEPYRGMEEVINSMLRHPYIIELIFSHDFAKAFWGEGQADEQYNVMDKYWHDTSCCSGGGCFFQGRRWQYHLQQMVLEEDPIKYLEQYV